MVVILSFFFAGISVYRDLADARLAVVNETADESLSVRIRTGEDRRFSVEIAKTPVDIEVGLMHRPSLGPDHGMLFQLGKEPRVAGFWMKNTLIPLDIIFIDATGYIVKIHESAMPGSLQTISSDAPVTGVLEIAGGRAKALGIQTGDRVIHKYFE